MSDSEVAKKIVDYNPKRTKFRKQHRGNLKGIATRGNSICFGKFALQALEPAWITRYARRGGKLWIRIFPDKPITVRPAETRMGSGKGSPEYWVAVVKPGKILYEISGVSGNIAKAAMRIAAYKMPIRTNFIFISGSQIGI
jgi:large subunit ribosomal protein L16